MRKCSVYVDEKTKDRLKALAKREGRNIINMLRVLVKGYKQNDGAVAVLQQIRRRYATTTEGGLIEVAITPELYEQIEAVLQPTNELSIRSTEGSDER